MDSREIKGLEVAARMRLVRDESGWTVPSRTSDRKYRVDPSATSCTCEDYAVRRQPCLHVFAVRFVIERENGNAAAVPEPKADATPHAARPTYKQNWPAYVRAQRSEKRRFLELLRDLCDGIPEPPRAKTGRKPVPLHDAVFACGYKVWSGLSSRRFNCDLEDAHAAGFLTRPIHPHKISSFMENDDLTPLLSQMVVTSSKPLAAVETNFAVDSTCFSGARHERWFDVRHGKAKTCSKWVKLQAMCGVKTNIVTAVEVLPTDGPDGPHLPPLVRTTAESFKIGDVTADKGYSSVDAHNAIADAGGTPFIAFKTVATGWSGGEFGRMFHYFQFRREEFLKHYHQRSNVEATFSAVKRKFGDSLRSKTTTAMMNEVLFKVVCHNISVLIHEQEELGIRQEINVGEERDRDVILKFPTACR